MPKRRSTWAELVVWSALSIALTACGGSGSSGFDIAAENHVIDSVLQTQQCAASDGLTICPVDAAPTQQPGTPTPSDGPRIDVGLGSSENLDCALANDGQACRIQFDFSAQGLPVDAAYRVAVRELDPSGPWTVVPTTATNGGPDAPSFAAGIQLPPSQAEIQLAVLVYINPDSAISGPIDSLAASGADFAFVTVPLGVAPRPAPS